MVWAKLKRRIRIRLELFLGSLSAARLIFGLHFFALSLTPSLLPRDQLVQGVLSGCAFAAGYGIGVLVEWVIWALDLRLPNNRITRAIGRGLVLVLAAMAFDFLWRWTDWQNSIRELMGMPEVTSGLPVQITFIALLPAALLIGTGTLVTAFVRAIWRLSERIVPTRTAFVVSMAIFALFTNLLINGLLLRSVLAAADRFYAELDALAGQFEAVPADPLRTGSSESLIPWNTIGRDARHYIQGGPTADDIEGLTGRPALVPLRTYVGLRSEDTPEARAELALAEMKRVGAFERSILVLIMPVGTGWVDPGAIDTLEILHGGNVASVALQYSYLTSPLSLLVEPTVGKEAAQALFRAVYGYWTALPPSRRPRLYLHGLSLGAYASQQSTSLLSIVDDLPQGALWAGPPFASEAWRLATESREPGTPQWLPMLRDNPVVRFTNQDNQLIDDDGVWGRFRIAYLQYGSDPIVFFDPSLFYAEPDWLDDPRARDVSPLLQWFPIVTGLQIMLDMALAQTSPQGFGHNYAAEDYLDAWVQITEPQGWSEMSLANLKSVLR